MPDWNDPAPAYHLLSMEEVIYYIFILRLFQSFLLAEAFLSGYLDRQRTHIASLGMYLLCKDAKMYYATGHLIYLSKNIAAQCSIFMVDGKRQEL